MNFKISEEEEVKVKKSHKIKMSEKFMIVIIIAISLVSGVTVYLISNTIFGKKKPVEVTDTKISTNDENVQILYYYVSHNRETKQDNIFVTKENVTIKDFNIEEKYYYALQFVQPEDLKFTGELTEDNEKIYLLSDEKIKGYMQRFFGSQIIYSSQKSLTYVFDFSINNKNLAVLEYSSRNKGYNVHFIDKENNEENPDLIEPYYTELSEAIKKADASLIIKEKVIYTELKENAGVYELNIYKDYQKTKLIEKKSGLSLDDLKNNPINMKKYKDTAGTITYIFRVDNTKYYFYNSSIAN
ncbi:MAG: hypothetical protein IJI22_02320 [Bacilli bacterium]|nr:hypothetical protein [Bacilli bacterium]